MDFITAAIASYNSPLLTIVFKFVTDYFYYIFFLFLLFGVCIKIVRFRSKWRKEGYITKEIVKKIKGRTKRELFVSYLRQFFPLLKALLKELLPLLITPIILFLIIMPLKDAFDIERICVEGISKIECPDSYSFPSYHAAVTAFLLPALLNTQFFILYFIFYLVVSFSRIYLGVHTLSDIAGGTIIGVSIYSIIETYVTKEYKKFKFLTSRSEIGRQTFHISFGILVIIFLFLLSQSFAEWHAIAIAFFLIFFYLAILAVSLKLSNIKIPVIDLLFSGVGGRDRFPAEGALWYFLGVLLTVTFLQEFMEIAIVIYILAIGDGISTLVNIPSKRYTPSIFKNKTPFSVFIFAISLLPIILFTGINGIFLIFLCTLAETMKTGINDNFLLPLVGVIFFLLV